MKVLIESIQILNEMQMFAYFKQIENKKATINVVFNLVFKSY